MSSTPATPLTIPAELEAELTPAVRAFVELLLARISDLESELEQLRGQMQRMQGTTPQNSSLPPSTQHPHAKPATRKKK